MHNTNKSRKFERAAIDGKFLFVVIGIFVGFFVIKPIFSSSAAINGKMDYELVSNFGEPVSKREIAKPG